MKCFFFVCWLDVVFVALYTLAGNAIDSSSNDIYLLLNAFIPLITSVVSLIPIIRQPSLDPLPPDAVRRDSLIFLILNFLAIITGIYLLIFGSSTSDGMRARLLLGGAILLLVFPLCIPDDLELHKELITRESSYHENGDETMYETKWRKGSGEKEGCCDSMVKKDRLAMLGEEHPVSLLVSRLDFWLYYTAYVCGGTIGLVYSNNLGQIAQSLGQRSNTTTLLTLYSSFSFFGRLLSAAPDYIRAKMYFARTAWLTIALVPTPIAFFLLAASGNAVALQISTALVGLSSGFIFAAAVSITSELFGPNSVGVNHNILITNIPIGSLVYGVLAAVVYDSHVSSRLNIITDSTVCMGRQCYFLTFVWWGCLSVLGFASSLLLFLRTRHAYDQFEVKRISSMAQLY
ncbi:hypothetical protein OIU77_023225 [Salix suchowensis]|uniref:Nodulin-like domain-containing protein n=1 Tax=Salix suchowensis TaxID=1278906 RepID=A0ABQ9C7G4_9ROSI|nr:hypothetical protein OIU77_023225 [Salix suchowensis]